MSGLTTLSVGFCFTETVLSPNKVKCNDPHLYYQFLTIPSRRQELSVEGRPQGIETKSRRGRSPFSSFPGPSLTRKGKSPY